MDLFFLLVIALTTTMAVPVVGALLIFSLLIGPPAAARAFTSKPLTAMALSVAIALITVWAAIAISFLSNLPVGFFVGTFGALDYVGGRGWTAWRQKRRSGRTLAPGAPEPSSASAAELPL
jgi:zinc/manganese transport system permease protein